MELIGKGYYYHVYDLGNGRVLKKEKSFWSKIVGIYYFEGKRNFAWLKATGHLFLGQGLIRKAYEYVKNHVDPKLVGSPKFLSSRNYEQDKLPVLNKFVGADQNENKRLIDLYIQNIIQCWRYGFSDKVYNFLINCGIDSNRNIVLLDFNEIELNKSKVAEHIISKRWLKSWAYNQIDQDLQIYYSEQMDKFITVESLEKNWNKNNGQ